jgi:hypothetical protein
LGSQRGFAYIILNLCTNIKLWFDIKRKLDLICSCPRYDIRNKENLMLKFLGKSVLALAITASLSVPALAQGTASGGTSSSGSVQNGSITVGGSSAATSNGSGSSAAVNSNVNGSGQNVTGNTSTAVVTTQRCGWFGNRRTTASAGGTTQAWVQNGNINQGTGLGASSSVFNGSQNASVFQAGANGQLGGASGAVVTNTTACQ